MKHIIGIDVGSEVSSVVGMTSAGRVVLETRISTSEKNFKELVKSLKPPRQVVFEECGQAAWLYSVLEPICDDVLVCNPKKNRDLSGNCKNDDRDAYNLAERNRIKKKRKQARTRGLVREYNRTLKYVFKHVGLDLGRNEWAHERARLEKAGVNSANAWLTLSRKAAAVALHLMKTGEMYDEALVFARK
jgi:hypothetical protein